MIVDTEKTPFESFEPFAPGALPAADPPTAGKKTRKKRTQAAQPVPATPATPKAGKARNPPAERRGKVARPASIDLQTAVVALVGLKPDDAQMLSRMVFALQNVPKKSRGRIVAALGKVFA
jgi:hypothetical protein